MAHSDLSPLDFAIRRCRYGDWPTLRRPIEECFPHLTLTVIQFMLCRHMGSVWTMHYGKVMSGFTTFYPTEKRGVAWLERIGVADSFRRICEEGRVTFETRVPAQTETRNRVTLFPAALIGQLAYIWRRFLHYCLLRSPKTLREQ